ncbi:MAG: hypothetical protein E7461_04890 [Ruminococcaceae bacterium]|nr:hypothetical protein [Oscillospiraceae bacterium]
MKKKVILSILIACLVIITVSIFISTINKQKRMDVNEILVGKTFSGSCRGSSFVWELEITIISKTHCNIYFYETIDGKRYSPTDYNNVPYTLSGGIGGVCFDWDDDIGPKNGAEPFEVMIRGNIIELYCPYYDSGIPLSLTSLRFE